MSHAIRDRPAEPALRRHLDLRQVSRISLDWTAIDADVAVLGAPFDFGTQLRAGRPLRARARCARPRRCSPSATPAPMTTKTTPSTCREAVADRRHRRRRHRPYRHGAEPRQHRGRACAASSSAGALPVVIGGDHSVNIPCIDAFDGQGPIHIVQIDAHLDFVDERHGVRFGHGSPMRRAAERPMSPA